MIVIAMVCHCFLAFLAILFLKADLCPRHNLRMMKTTALYRAISVKSYIIMTFSTVTTFVGVKNFRLRPLVPLSGYICGNMTDAWKYVGSDGDDV